MVVPGVDAKAPPHSEAFAFGSDSTGYCNGNTISLLLEILIIFNQDFSLRNLKIYLVEPTVPGFA